MSSTFFNPLMGRGPDPWMTYHQGSYYLSYTSGERIQMHVAARIQDLISSEPHVVWRDLNASRCKEMWAPEFYLFETDDGPHWFGYYTASDGNDLNHRLHVIESDGTNLLGPYRYAGKLRTDRRDEYYAIDGTVLHLETGERYLLWAGHPGHVLFISALSDPLTTIGERVNIPADGFGCSEVREGPVCLVRNGQIFLIYSACDTGKPDYKLGMLTAKYGSNLLDPKSWTQHPTPVFARCDENEVYGPGHNHFFKSPDGTEDWIIYHAKSVKEYTYEHRSARAQQFFWGEDGLPHFGVPVPLGFPLKIPSYRP